MTLAPKSPDILALWRNAQAVCFDVDSTVSMDEGIDVLAAHAGVGPQVAALTAQAMGGTVLFQDALRQRLEVIRPTKHLLTTCLRDHPPRLSPGIAELVNALHHRKVAVYLITGGFEQMVEPIIKRLGIPRANLIANVLRFDADGGYHGFDPDAPTARSGGKGTAVAGLKRTFGYRPIVMVGDGVTDLEARPPADGFIGYGGVVTRPRVEEGADWFVTDFHVLLDEFNKEPPTPAADHGHFMTRKATPRQRPPAAAVKPTAKVAAASTKQAKAPVRYWLMKTEPEAFGIDHLRAKGSAPWDGVRNYQARNYMREMAIGDQVLFYHSNAKPSGIAGLAEVSALAYPDPTSWDPASAYFDPGSSPQKPRWFMVEVRYLQTFTRFLSLAELHTIPELSGMVLLHKSRLSVQPVSAQHFAVIVKLAT